jgi:pimeloyl-ACP methyl ester carboxylesterase
MSRGPKIALAVLAVLAVLLALNTITLDSETKDAEVRVDGGEIVRLAGGDLQVLDLGPRDRPPIVLLHCFACAIDYWDRLTPVLGDRHRVIAFDLLGHGGSEGPDSGYSVEDQATLISEAMARLGVEAATVVGHSLGGAVAVAVAEQSSALVDRVVIIDTAPDDDYGDLGFLAKLAFVPVIGEAFWRLAPDFAIEDGLEVAFAPGFDVPDEFVDDVREMTYSSYDASPAAFDDYVSERPLDQRLGDISLPTLVMFGAEEQIVDEPEVALRAYEMGADAQTELIEDAGHSPNVETPGETARLILNFIRSTGIIRLGAAPSGRTSDRSRTSRRTPGRQGSPAPSESR